MRYVVGGVTYSGGHFYSEVADENSLESTIKSTVCAVDYFGGGSVTVYEVDEETRDIRIVYFAGSELG